MGVENCPEGTSPEGPEVKDASDQEKLDILAREILATDHTLQEAYDALQNGDAEKAKEDILRAHRGLLVMMDPKIENPVDDYWK